jgi:hypothetical protein
VAEGVGVDVVVVVFDGIDGGRPQTWDSVVLTKTRLGLFGSHIALCAGVNVDDCGGAAPWPSAIFKTPNSNTRVVETIAAYVTITNSSVFQPVDLVTATSFFDLELNILHICRLVQNK